MPEWLLFVISGILAGGIPGFGIDLCCFLHPLNWRLWHLAELTLLMPSRHKHCDKLHVPDDLQVLWLDMIRSGQTML